VSIRVNGLDALPKGHRGSLRDFLHELRPGETARLAPLRLERHPCRLFPDPRHARKLSRRVIEMFLTLLEE
jgi:hypothetical protein